MTADLFYRQIATLLADLREALAGTGQAGLAEEQARKLKGRQSDTWALDLRVTATRVPEKVRRVGEADVQASATHVDSA
jgi:hypothetical protein